MNCGVKWKPISKHSSLEQQDLVEIWDKTNNSKCQAAYENLCHVLIFIENYLSIVIECRGVRRPPQDIRSPLGLSPPFLMLSKVKAPCPRSPEH